MIVGNEQLLVSVRRLISLNFCFFVVISVVVTVVVSVVVGLVASEVDPDESGWTVLVEVAPDSGEGVAVQ